MPYILNYNEAAKILSHISSGICSGVCKDMFLGDIKYALKSKMNPLRLTATERKSLTEEVNRLSRMQSQPQSLPDAAPRKKYRIRKSRRARSDPVNVRASTLKKYKTRNSPPYPANRNCNRTMKGNDGRMYISKANKNGVCSWKKIT
jgi:hypothetical protein